MAQAAEDGDAYLDAFMNGFEFVLLAMRGRLAEDGVPPAERARLEGFLADYFRISRAYRERRVATPETTPRILGAVRAEVEAVPLN